MRRDVSHMRVVRVLRRRAVDRGDCASRFGDGCEADVEERRVRTLDIHAVGGNSVLYRANWVKDGFWTRQHGDCCQIRGMSRGLMEAVSLAYEYMND